MIAFNVGRQGQARGEASNFSMLGLYSKEDSELVLVWRVDCQKKEGKAALLETQQSR